MSGKVERPGAMKPAPATDEEISQAVADGVLDPIITLMGAFTIQGGPTKTPDAFQEWLAQRRAAQRGMRAEPCARRAEIGVAAPSLDANWCGGSDTRLMTLHSVAGLLRDELTNLDLILEAAERAPAADSVEALMRALDSVALFQRSIYRHLGLVLVEDVPEVLQ